MSTTTRSARWFRRNPATIVLALVLGIASCAGAGGRHSGGGGAAVPTRVALVVLENANYADIVGAASMPYLNSLIASYGLATNYFANAHPSVPNYFMLTTGQLITTDDNFAGVVADDNLVREMANSSRTWKSYAESLPSPGYIGPDVFPYTHKHVPFTYFTDVINNPAQASNIVPLTQLATDLQNGSLPDFLFIVPNVLHGIHDCPPANPGCTLADRAAIADQWLSANVAPLLQDAAFQTNGLLIIVFDEAEASDLRNGGGQVACVIAGGSVKPGYHSTTFYQHQNLLALIGSVLRLGAIPGAGATASNMNEFLR